MSTRGTPHVCLEDEAVEERQPCGAPAQPGCVDQREPLPGLDQARQQQSRSTAASEEAAGTVPKAP